MQCSRDGTCHKDDNQSAVFTCFGKEKNRGNKEVAVRVSGIIVNKHYRSRRKDML